MRPDNGAHHAHDGGEDNILIADVLADEQAQSPGQGRGEPPVDMATLMGPLSTTEGTMKEQSSGMSTTLQKRRLCPASSLTARLIFSSSVAAMTRKASSRSSSSYSLQFNVDIVACGNLAGHLGGDDLHPGARLEQ
ncbi:MAG: hypothetical protein MZU91_13390 [Desulfosudis oleivorans]|nr:hypothetical protein [Desulfosudis oleivorans]